MTPRIAHPAFNPSGLIAINISNNLDYGSKHALKLSVLDLSDVKRERTSTEPTGLFIGSKLSLTAILVS